MPNDRWSAPELAQMLAGVGPASGPLHRRLAESLTELIDRGELPPGGLLPSERSLAAALALSRTTVVTAYRALDESGRLDRRQGSGTRVKSSTTRETVSGPMITGSHAASEYLDGPLATIDFATAALPGSDLVAQATSDLSLADCLRLTRTHHGYHLRGLLSLRDRIALWYTENGRPTQPEEILITSGAQQALELIARGCLRPGDNVVMEDPTYRGALDTLTRAGSRVHQVAMDDQGVDVEALSRCIDEHSPRLAYLQPAKHNPTGVALSTQRRQRLIQLIQTNETVVVDDTSLQGTVFAGTHNPPALISHPRLITIGSMSKLFWGGLRLGWIRADAQVVSRLALLRGVTDLGTSLITQEIARRLFDHIDEAREERVRTLPTGLETLTQLLDRDLPDWTARQPTGGASLWIQLPHGDAAQFSQVASRFGVALLPGSAFSTTNAGDQYTRLPYCLPEAVLEAGVQRLKSAWRSYIEHGLGDLTISAAMT